MLLVLLFCSCSNNYDIKISENDSLIVYKEGEFIDNKFTGIKKVYFKKSKRLYWKVWLENDVPTGIYEQYFENGQLEYYSHVKNGIENGWQFTYYKNGKINMISKLKNNEIIDTCRVYYPNGNLNFYHFINSNVVYFYYEFNEKGALISEFHRVDMTIKSSLNMNVGDTINVDLYVYGSPFYNRFVSCFIRGMDESLRFIRVKDSKCNYKVRLSKKGNFLLTAVTCDRNAKNEYYDEISITVK